MATLKVPERLGKYPITGVIGRGAMGIVFKGYDPVIKRPVAIKTIRKELLEDDDVGSVAASGASGQYASDTMSSRFQREAQAAGALNHPGIVSVYEYGEDSSYAFIAMELVEGSNLRDYIANGTSFDEQDTVSIMSQLLDALHYAHSSTVWHRDIKPANIMVMSNGRIKLTDFGIARLESADRTRTNVIMGTPGYIAPELYLGGHVDHRMDIFAAGVVFYQLLARKSPFRGGPEAIMHDVCYHDPEPASKADPAHRWSQYDAIVARAIAKAPADRFQSAGDFRSAILDAYAQPVANTISEATIVTHRSRSAFADPGPGSGGAVPSTPSPKTFCELERAAAHRLERRGAGRRRSRDRQVHRTCGQGVRAPRRQGAQGPRVAGRLADAGDRRPQGALGVRAGGAGQADDHAAARRAQDQRRHSATGHAAR